ncbi:MAG: cytochrome c biogenesis heme-transporting ATPase CcmA [Massilia sp.]
MALEAVRLGAARGGHTLFSGVGFALGAGEALWLGGTNGSGKTTLLRLLCGLALPADGEVLWQGQPIRRLREDYHRALLYCGHASGVKDDLTAWENLATSAALAGRSCTRAQAEDALAHVGLRDQAALPARVLSQGQRRRVVLARLALAPLPQLLLLDEPFSALDGAATLALCATLDAHLERGGIVVYTTHQAQALNARRLLRLELGAAASC